MGGSTTRIVLVGKGMVYEATSLPIRPTLRSLSASKEHRRRFLMVRRQRRTTRSMTICSSAAVVAREVSICGDRCATVNRQRSLATKLVWSRI